MMSDNEFHRRLAEWLNEETERRKDLIVFGQIDDLATYKQHAGYLQALRDVAAMGKTILRKTNSAPEPHNQGTLSNGTSRNLY